MEIKTLNGFKFNIIPFDINFSDELCYIYNLYKHTRPGLLVKDYHRPDHFNNRKYPVSFHPYLCCHNILNLASHLNNNTTTNADIKKIESLVSELENTIAEFNSGFYFGYPFELDILGKRLDTPFYSALSQAYILSAFIKLYYITNEKKYLYMAEKTHLTFFQFRKQSNQKDPWVTFIDDERFLWFEEYPSSDDPQTRALNGHIYGIMGLYTYYCFNKDEKTLALIQAGMTTVQRYFNDFRRPGNVNNYSLLTNTYPDYLPERSVNQQRWLYEITGDKQFYDQYLAFKSDMK